MQGLVTVFGGSGFVGAQVVRALAKKGVRVRVAVRRPGRGYRMRMLGDVGQIEVVQANIRDEASIERALAGAEACVNLVSTLYHAGNQTFQALNVDGAKLVAQVAARRGITNFVQMSAIGADENSASEYARTKALGEAAVRSVIPSAVIIRPSIVFGQDDDFFNRFSSLAATLPMLPLVGGGETKFQPVFVGDVGAAIARVVTDPNCAGKTFELGGPSTYSFRELMELVVRETQRNRALVPVPWGVAGLIGLAGDIQAWAKGIIGLIPRPQLTRDQVELLKTDNVADSAAAGLAELGVQATALEPMLPTYLYRYRKGGQFAEIIAAESAR